MLTCEQYYARGYRQVIFIQPHEGRPSTQLLCSIGAPAVFASRGAVVAEHRACCLPKRLYDTDILPNLPAGKGVSYSRLDFSDLAYLEYVYEKAGFGAVHGEAVAMPIDVQGVVKHSLRIRELNKEFDDIDIIHDIGINQLPEDRRLHADGLLHQLVIAALHWAIECKVQTDSAKHRVFERILRPDPELKKLGNTHNSRVCGVALKLLTACAGLLAKADHLREGKLASAMREVDRVVRATNWVEVMASWGRGVHGVGYTGSRDKRRGHFRFGGGWTRAR